MTNEMDKEDIECYLRDIKAILDECLKEIEKLKRR
jgi:hypothetical protein